jgi:hypothetical protein
MGLAGSKAIPQSLDELQKLREENIRLKSLLTSHGIAWEKAPIATVPESFPTESIPTTIQLSTTYKITLFRRLFRGRTDVSIHNDGNQPRARQAIHQLVAMNGGPEFVTSQRSSAAIAPSVCCCRSLIWQSTIIWREKRLSASTPC